MGAPFRPASTDLVLIAIPGITGAKHRSTAIATIEDGGASRARLANIADLMSSSHRPRDTTGASGARRPGTRRRSRGARAGWAAHGWRCHAKRARAVSYT